MAEPVLTFKDLTLGYNSHPAVHHLSGIVAKGSLTAIVGANGSGKSTLMKGIVGILPAMSGSVARAEGVSSAYLPQQSELDRTFPARVVDLVSMGLWPRRGLLGWRKPGDREVVASALRSVGLSGFEARALDTLSGGQLQRALFARVIVQDADLILLDEPFNAVDETTIADLLALIHGWQSEGRTVMMVAHDLALVRQHFPRTLLLARSPIAWGSTAEVLRPDNLQRARHFHEAWDSEAPWCAPEDPGHGHADAHDHAHAHGAHHHDAHAPTDTRAA